MSIPEMYLHPKWRDMSDWVVHFTRTDEQLRSILGDGEIRASGPFGWKSFDETTPDRMSACLSEIPLDHLSRLCRRHGYWGLGFRKQFITQAGGERVWYVERQGPVGSALFKAIGELLQAQDTASPLLKLTPFIDGMADGEPYTYRFDWEREWRVPGGLHFQLTDVAFVLTPEDAAGPVAEDSLRVLPSTSVEEFAEHAVAELGDELDQRIAQFLAEFTDPANKLPYSSADSHQSPVWEWSTPDAVSDVFGNSLTDDMRDKLVLALNEISTSWTAIAYLSGAQ